MVNERPNYFDYFFNTSSASSPSNVIFLRIFTGSPQPPSLTITTSYTFKYLFLSSWKFFGRLRNPTEITFRFYFDTISTMFTSAVMSPNRSMFFLLPIFSSVIVSLLPTGLIFISVPTIKSFSSKTISFPKIFKFL